MEKGMGGRWRRKRDGVGLDAGMRLEKEVETDTQTETAMWKKSGKNKREGRLPTEGPRSGSLWRRAC